MTLDLTLRGKTVAMFVKDEIDKFNMLSPLEVTCGIMYFLGEYLGDKVKSGELTVEEVAGMTVEIKNFVDSLAENEAVKND